MHFLYASRSRGRQDRKFRSSPMPMLSVLVVDVAVVDILAAVVVVVLLVVV